MNFEKYNSKEKIEISDDVKNQLENLGLKIDDLEGKILDVGAGEGEFAREIKKVSKAEIVSVDDYKKEGAIENIIIADVRELPFENDSFDRVISHASIPNIFVGIYNKENPQNSFNDIKESITKSFSEILRVLKKGSSAIMAPVRIAENYDSQKALKNALKEVLDKFEAGGVEVKSELIKEVADPVNKELHKEYRLTLIKK